MELQSKVKFVNRNLKKDFDKLAEGKTEDKELRKWLSNAFSNIENNAFCGIQIPKKLIPTGYLKEYSIHNLWKYNLPEAWRLLYSIENKGDIVLSEIIEWMKHKEYERKFGY